MYTYLANILIAAALGAGTNELAIIAILRHILPRKKGEIARRIRDLVATDLLSPEKLLQKLDDPIMGELLRRHLDQALADLLKRDLPPPEELLREHRAEFGALAARLRDSLLDELAARAGSPGFARDVVRPFLAERWRELGARTPRSLLTAARAESLPARAEEWVASLENSPALRDAARGALDGWLAGKLARSESPADFLSPGLAAAAEELAAAQAPLLMRHVTDALREPTIQEAITGAIMNAIRQQLDGQGVLGGIKGAFVSAMRVQDDIRGVCRRLPDTLYHNLHRRENYGAFESLLREAVRKMLRQRFASDLNAPESRERIVGLIMDRVWREKNFRRLAANAAAFVRSALEKSLEESLGDLGGDAAMDGILDEAAERVRRMLAAPATRELLAARFDEFLAGWMARPLGRLDRFVSPETRSALAEAAAGEALQLLRLRLADIVEESGMWDIVTASIEGYDDREIGDMVRQLARSELRWVTILGGVIGGVVGLLQSLLNAALA